MASTFSRRNAEIDCFLWHAREPFDDAQLTVLSNFCEPSSSAAAHAVDSDAVLSPLEGRRRPADAGTRARRLRFVAPQHRLSPHRVQAGYTDAVVATAAGGSPSLFRVTSPSSTTSRARAATVSPRCPCIRRSTPLPRRSSQERCRVGAREDTAAIATTHAVSSDQLNSLALRFAVGKRVRE